MFLYLIYKRRFWAKISLSQYYLGSIFHDIIYLKVIYLTISKTKSRINCCRKISFGIGTLKVSSVGTDEKYNFFF